MRGNFKNNSPNFRYFLFFFVFALRVFKTEEMRSDGMSSKGKTCNADA